MYSKEGVLVDRREMLRVKIKSLAAESKMIRLEERRSALGRKHIATRRDYAEKMKRVRENCPNELERRHAIAAVRIEFRAARAKLRPRRDPDPLFQELYQHRVLDVRRESRHAHIAYGLIRGRSLERIETAPKTPPNWAEIERLVKKYGPAGFVVQKPTS